MSSCPAGGGGGGGTWPLCPSHLFTSKKSVPGTCAAQILAYQGLAHVHTWNTSKTVRVDLRGRPHATMPGRERRRRDSPCHPLPCGLCRKAEGGGLKQESCHATTQKGQQKNLGATLGACDFFNHEKIFYIQYVVGLLCIPPQPASHSTACGTATRRRLFFCARFLPLAALMRCPSSCSSLISSGRPLPGKASVAKSRPPSEKERASFVENARSAGDSASAGGTTSLPYRPSAFPKSSGSACEA